VREFRYIGLSLQDKRVTGYVEAKSRGEAKRKAESISRLHKFRLTAVQGKSNYLYKVRNKDGMWLRGEQEAFSKDDVDMALRRMGFDFVSVQKVAVDIRFKPPYGEVITFIRMSADMLREKIPFDEILTLLESDMTNRALKRSLKEILVDLKSGKDGEEAFSRQVNSLGKFPCRMLGVASKSGNMAEVYENTAKFLERDYEFRKSIRSALLQPSITLLVLFGAVVFYIGYIFPKTAELFSDVGAILPPMTKASLDLGHYVQNNIALIIMAMLFPPLVLWRLARTEKGQILAGRYFIRLPIIGFLLHKSSIEIFCRVFNSLYSGSGENIEVIRTSAEACRNKYMEKRIKEISIPMMVRDGRGFVESLKAAGVFTDNAINRLNAGAESGTLKKVTAQIANFYERETTYRMKTIVDSIQVVIAFIIMIIMTMLTIISSETAVVQPKLPGM
jgi:type IV pilus assembly protein PilC